MLSFWIISGLLLAIALIIILPGLFAEPPAELDHNKTNKAVYENKLSELQNDLTSDLIDQEQYLLAKADLERALLDDIEESNRVVPRTKSRLLPIFLLFFIPSATVLLYLQLDNGLKGLDPEFQQEMIAQQSNAAAGQMGSVEQAISNLEEKIKREPDNLEHLQLLGRSYVSTERFDDAVTIYKKANDLSNGANPDILVAYGEALGFAAADNKFDETSMMLFSKALQIDPDHERGLWYAGLTAYQFEDYQQAVVYFEKLIQHIPADQVDVRDALIQYLNEVRQKAGMEEFETETYTEENPASIVVNVSFADHIVDKIKNSDTLFVYARAINGSKMPLVLVKMTAEEVPATITLDNSASMLPGMTLSSVEQVEVIARISKSGGAAVQAGDLYGSVQPVETAQSRTVDVVISEVVLR